MDNLIPPSPLARNYRHGHKTAGKYSSEYAIWNNMRARCGNPNSNRFHRYGLRGIRVCDRWQNDFVNFLEDMGRRPSSDHQLDRINNDGNYEPSNCRWATRQEQCRNRSSSNFITIDGESKTSAEWSEVTGISQSAISARIKKLGWTPEKAVKTPLRGSFSKDGKTWVKSDVFTEIPSVKDFP